ncbi:MULTISPECIES: DJ-1/PfpI family protein [unclassified Streptomyces]|uniref:DJ-1/PfpI family protein n=1 Tax=unclassified Streptomyces TaxID=2593676 RepID=UPI000DC798C8|nr:MULTISPECIES: DJ-1/PfpI family protein [unclassified Streptomyces]AWZ05986.1 DJ-1/PfpI family protein [Streptomyces sp. ICC4]AWZ13538.1 DJ-1/PfpI family protein [Streptomyces sp. ICC1]
MLIVFPLYPGFTALDAVGPYEVLRFLPGAEVVFAAERPGPVRADSGVLRITADAALSDIGSCDAVVVPGGPGSRALADPSAPYVRWLREVHPDTRWTTSVCTGALLLGAAGILEGLQAATHWNSIDRLESFGASSTEQRVVFQGKVVTAAGVSSGIDMALALAARIEDAVTAQAIQLLIEYDPRPPFDMGSPAKATPEVRERAREIAADARAGRGAQA